MAIFMMDIFRLMNGQGVRILFKSVSLIHISKSSLKYIMKTAIVLNMTKMAMYGNKKKQNRFQNKRKKGD